MPKSLVKNVGDPEQVKAGAEKEKLGRERDLADFMHVMESAQGRRVVYRYLGICGLYRTSFTGNNTTFFNEGRRDIGLQLMADVQDSSPELYLKMLHEAKEAE